MTPKRITQLFKVCPLNDSNLALYFGHTDFAAGGVITDCDRKRGRHGFDMGRETFGACRACGVTLKSSHKVIVANDDNYALAA